MSVSVPLALGDLRSKVAFQEAKLIGYIELGLNTYSESAEQDISKFRTLNTFMLMKHCNFKFKVIEAEYLFQNTEKELSY